MGGVWHVLGSLLRVYRMVLGLEAMPAHNDALGNRAPRSPEFDPKLLRVLALLLITSLHQPERVTGKQSSLARIRHFTGLTNAHLALGHSGSHLPSSHLDKECSVFRRPRYRPGI